MREEIKYMVKPDWISWDDIQLCQATAHKKNREIGVAMHAGEISGDELKKALKNGVCYVAYDGKRVVGTVSIIPKIMRFLWKKYKTGYLCYESVLPELQGCGVFRELSRIRMEDAKKQNIEMFYLRTAENNIRVRNLRERMGYKYIGYSSFKACNYYSVTMAKWINGKPLPDWLLNLVFSFSGKYIKLRFKPRRIKRFGI